MRCPICGSKMIYPSAEHKQFSGGKAVAGMIAFGIIGGAAGFIGKDIKGYKCSACGAFSQEAMSYSVESAINLAVNAAKNNNDFAQYNIFRESYPNIEQVVPSHKNESFDTVLNSLPYVTTAEKNAVIKRVYSPKLYACDSPVYVENLILKTHDDKDFLSFVAWNKSSKKLRSVYFDIKVLDDAGDLITETNCVFQGLAVNDREKLPIETEFPLNTNLAYKIEFKCVKATFHDDTVWRDEDKPVYILSEQDIILEENFSKYRALKLKFSETENLNGRSEDVVIYQPIVEENYIQCVCGYPFNTQERCFNCGRNVDDIGELISFDVLDEYEKEIIKQKAETRYAECKKFRDNALINNYHRALSLMREESISSVQRAILIFSKMEDYKDSKEQLNLCYERKNQLEEKEKKEEAERLDEERIAEEERIAKEKAKKKKKKIISRIIITAVCAIAVFVLALYFYIIPSSKYNNALSLTESGNLQSAYNAFVDCKNFKDAPNKAEEVRFLLGKKSLENIKVGDTIFFGMYEQDNDMTNGKEFIDWQVLDIKDNKALVISKYILDQETYHDSRSEVTWEDCYLRSWLNSTFYDSAFNNNEKDLIQLSSVPAHKNPRYTDVNQGNDTKDKVFLLSMTEMSKYFKAESDRVSPSTEYAISQDKAPNPPGCVHDYWLRTSGRETLFAVTVFNEQSDYVDPGAYYESGVIVYSQYDNGEYDVEGVRPAMWIDLSKIQ